MIAFSMLVTAEMDGTDAAAVADDLATDVDAGRLKRELHDLLRSRLAAIVGPRMCHLVGVEMETPEVIDCAFVIALDGQS